MEVTDFIKEENLPKIQEILEKGILNSSKHKDKDRSLVARHMSKLKKGEQPFLHFLNEVVKFGDCKVVKKLIDLGVPITLPCVETAVCIGDYKMTKLLLKNGGERSHNTFNLAQLSKNKKLIRLVFGQGFFNRRYKLSARQQLGTGFPNMLGGFSTK